MKVVSKIDADVLLYANRGELSFASTAVLVVNDKDDIEKLDEIGALLDENYKHETL